MNQEEAHTDEDQSTNEFNTNVDPLYPLKNRVIFAIFRPSSRRRLVVIVSFAGFGTNHIQPSSLTGDAHAHTTNLESGPGRCCPLRPRRVVRELLEAGILRNTQTVISGFDEYVEVGCSLQMKNITF